MALPKRPSDTDLMAPPPAPKRIKRPPIVLDEETYQSAVSFIVARDFFPSIVEHVAQDEYLEALRSGDSEWINDAGRRVQEAMTPVAATAKAGETPARWTGETPRNEPGATPRSPITGTSPAKALPGVDLSLSLGEFQARYTSEDSESFKTILDGQNEKRREKAAWMWNRNTKPSKQQLAQAAVEQARKQRLRATSKDGAMSEKQALVLQRDMDARSKEPDRPAMIDAARKTRDPRNSLMFTPDDLGTRHPDHKSRAQIAQEASRAGAKGVVYANTRLVSHEAPVGGAVPPSPSISAIDAAIRGQPHPGFRRGGAYADSDAPGSSDVGGAETPRMNGYAYVDEEPTEAELDAVDGRVRPQAQAALPDLDHQAILKSIRQSHDGGDEGMSGPNPFSIEPTSKRETLHHALVQKNSKAKRATGTPAASTPIARKDRLAALKSLGRTPTPIFASSPKPASGGRKKNTSAALTPAAQALYEKVGRTPKSGGGAF